MTRKLLLPVVLLSLTAPAIAQPTMTEADAPHIGQSFEFRIGTYSAITATGENIVWDLTGAGDDGSATVNIISPDEAPAGGSFLDAEMAWSEPGRIAFSRVDATGIYVNGTYVSAQDLAIHYTDEYLQVPYPCTYNTTVTDPYVAVYDVSGDQVTSTGSETLVADGYGDLMLPWGTVENVLKVTVNSEAHDFYNDMDFHTVVASVYFYRPGLGLHLLTSSDFDLFVDDVLTQTGQSLFYMSQSTVGVDEALAEEIGVDAFPVPAHDRLSVVFGIAAGHGGTATLHDATGKAVRAFAINTKASGIQREDMDVSGLAAGVYLLRIVDDHGQRGTRRVVIE